MSNNEICLYWFNNMHVPAVSFNYDPNMTLGQLKELAKLKLYENTRTKTMRIIKHVVESPYKLVDSYKPYWPDNTTIEEYKNYYKVNDDSEIKLIFIII
jgi:hypothetical protein